MKTVLLVEDSATTRALIKAVIDDMGPEFSIVEAASGFEALKLLPREQFDLIITDINMPDLNGLEFINFVKTNQNYKHVPIIIITTERSREDRERGLSLGANDYITKPFKAEELHGAIAKLLAI